MKFCAFDTESEMITPGCWPEIACLTYCVEGQTPVIVAGKNEIVKAWRWLLAAGYTLVCHNAAFDVGLLVSIGAMTLPEAIRLCETGRIRCTMVRENLISLGTRGFCPPDASMAAALKARFGWDRSEDKGDKDLAEPYQGRPYRDWPPEVLARLPWRYNYAKLIDVPLDQWPPEAVRYPLQDATDVLALWRDQTGPELAANGASFWDRSNNSFPGEFDDVADSVALEWSARRGIVADLLEATALIDRVRIGKAAAVALGQTVGEPCAACNRLGRIGKARCKPCSGTGFVSVVRPDGSKNTKYLAERVERGQRAAGRRDKEDPAYNPDLGKISRTEKGAISTDGEAIERTGDTELVNWYHDWQAFDKLNSTYLPKVIRALSGPLCTRYRVAVETGRTSGDLQNPPRKGGFRECFVPRPGFAFVSIDFEAAELAALAQVILEEFGSSKLADAINAGQDPHCILGGQLADVPLDHDTLRARVKTSDPAAKALRQFAKIGNFGLAGMLGIESFVSYAAKNGVKLDRHKAAHIKGVWSVTWPEMAGYFRAVKHVCQNLEGTFSISQGNRGPEHRPRVVYGRRPTSGANILFQARVAIFAKLAFRRVVEATAPGGRLEGAHAVLFVHDEAVLEVPLDRMELADVAAEIMLEAAQVVCPGVKLRAEPAAMLRLTKDSKTVRGPDGKLIAV